MNPNDWPAPGVYRREQQRRMQQEPTPELQAARERGFRDGRASAQAVIRKLQRMLEDAKR